MNEDLLHDIIIYHEGLFLSKLIIIIKANLWIFINQSLCFAKNYCYYSLFVFNISKAFLIRKLSLLE